MSVHAYPVSALYGDYLRAAAGLLPCLAILAAVPLVPLMTAAVSGLAALFAGFAIRTGLRQRTRIAMTEAGLCASGPFGAQIPWAALDGMKLSYYSTRREGGDGWMQLVLRAGRAKLSLDSRIEGFPLLVAGAARAAAVRHLPLNGATQANLEALGVKPAEPPSAIMSVEGESA